MTDDLYLLITIVRKCDMQMLRYMHKCKNNDYFGKNYMYWNEEDFASIYKEIFDFDEEVVILNVEEIDGVK